MHPIVAIVLAAAALTAACDGRLMELSSGVSGAGVVAPRTVVFLSASAPEALPAEEAAAWAWLQEREEFSARLVQFIDLPAARLPRDAILWWHYAAEEALPSVSVRRPSLRAVQAHLRAGGNLLLSLIAASYVVPLEIESAPPDIVSRRAPFAGADADTAGFQSRGHPLVARFRGGVLPTANPVYRQTAAVAYRDDRWPAEGKVWAVHQTERGVRADIKIGIEYTDVYGTGANVVTLGAHCYFADTANRNRVQLEQLVVDALRYLDRQAPRAPPGADLAPVDAAAQDPATGVDRRYWRPSRDGFVEAAVEPTALPPAADASLALNLVDRSRSGLEITRFDDPSPFTLASPRAQVRGSQLGRIDEFRVHPRVVLRSLRIGIVRPDRGVTWLDDGGGSREFTARPEGNELHYNDGEVEVRLHLTVDRRYPALVALLAVRSPAAVDVIATWRADVDTSAPEGADRAAAEIGWDGEAQAFVWRDAGGFVAKGGFGRATQRSVVGFVPTLHLREDGLLIAEEPTSGTPAEAAGAETAEARIAPTGVDAPATDADTTGGGESDAPPAVEVDPARVAAQVRIEPGRPALLPLVIVGGDAGEVDVDRVFAELIAAPARPWVANADHYRDYVDRRTMGLLAPDAEFQAAFRWAKVGVESLRAELPGVGVGILSGLGTQDITGTWLATPDALGGSGALWAAMAADAYGDRSLAAETLRTIARFQAVDGRLPDAVTSPLRAVDNGATATAVFLIALDNHVRTWGAGELLDELWPTAQRAADFLAAADRDDDGLLEAISRDDRWSTDLAVQTPIDLAALTAAAWQATGALAVVMGDGELAARAAEAAARVMPMLDGNGPFWNANDRRFNFAKRRDGSFVPVSTVLPAIPMLFELIDPGLANAGLDAFSSSAFSRDWGVRLIGTAAEPSAAGETADSEPPTAPVGSPAAAADVVSPLFTGWTALAEYRNHRPEAGFAHALTNLLLLQHANAGYATAAFDGTGFVPRGGIVHGAGAQAMTLLPVVWGMLGIRPDAVNGTIRISPQLPATWSRVNVDPVRVGNAAFRLKIRRTTTRIEFEVDAWSGARDVVLEFIAHVPADLAIALAPEMTGFEIIGDEIVPEPGRQASAVMVRPTSDASISTLAFNHDPFPRVMPPQQLTARPQQVSGGLRLVRSRYIGGVLGIQAEGLPGQQYALTVATPWRVLQVTGVPSVRVVNSEEGIATIYVDIPGSGGRYRPIDLEVTFDR